MNSGLEIVTDSLRSRIFRRSAFDFPCMVLFGGMDILHY